jgi:4-aminobutyrate---pyruvate transaminase
MTFQPNSPSARDIAHVLHPYTNLARHEEIGPLVLERGSGVRVYDTDGKEYIDALAGLWCAALGFGAEEELIKAATEQMRKLPFYHAFGGKSTPPIIALAEKLKKLSPVPMSKAFFVNSGSEANDTLVKIIWYYNNARGRPNKKKIISRTRAYHGVTVATASLTGLIPNHRDFDLPIARILHTDCPHHYRFAAAGESEEEFSARLAGNLEQLILREGPDTVAAFFAEPVMGAGGVIVPPKGYFAKIQAVLKKYDILFAADEVITGFGRTGNVWGCQTYDIKPDFISCAKQLSAGQLPIAACLIPEFVYQAMIEESRKIGTFGHGYTYGGHPVPAAVALRTLELYEERDILGNVRGVMPRFQARLKRLADHPLVGEARGVGLIGAVELVADKQTKRPFNPARWVGAYCMGRSQEHGLIQRAVQDNLAFCPPLIVSETEIDAIFDRFEKALDDTEAWVTKEKLRAA